MGGSTINHHDIESYVAMSVLKPNCKENSQPPGFFEILMHGNFQFETTLIQSLKINLYWLARGYTKAGPTLQ